MLIAITILLSKGFPSSSDHLTLQQRSNIFETQNLITIVKRSEWCKIKSIQGKKKLTMPVPKAIIMQTFTKECVTKVNYIQNEFELFFVIKSIILQAECKEYLVEKQNKDYPKVNDIKENFFVGHDGTIYEGRGFTREGEHTYGKYSIFIHLERLQLIKINRSFWNILQQ